MDRGDNHQICGQKGRRGHTPCPQRRSIDAVYRGNLLNPCFASNLEPFIEQHQPALWVHGHLHSCSDYTIGRTRVIANPRGYPSENTRGFNPSLVVEV
jgi:Icc-related predicted phosphoesterase